MRLAFLAILVLVPVVAALEGDAFRHDGHLGPGLAVGLTPTASFYFSGQAGDVVSAEVAAADPHASLVVRAVKSIGGCEATDLPCMQDYRPTRLCYVSPLVPSSAWTTTLPADGLYKLWVEPHFAPVGADYRLEVQVAGGAGDVRYAGTSVTSIAYPAPSCPTPLPAEP